MFKHIAGQIGSDNDYPERTNRLNLFKRVLDGTFYDVLPNMFHEEYDGAGNYISVTNRAPSVRSNLCRTVVEDSVSMLFSEGRFPVFETGDKSTRDALARLAKESGLNRTMIDAAQRGSIGSIVVQMRVLKGRLFFQVLETLFLTPEWDPEEPDTLLRVTERYKIRGGNLAAMGYAIPKDQWGAEWWFQRVWDATAETWFLPQSREDATADPPKPPQPDPERTVQNDLGFVPLVWIKNLPGGDAVDGSCTFKPGIETVVDLDYLMSGGHRALMYQAAPRLVIKTDSEDMPAKIGPGDALMVGSGDDAKMLEISGGASEAIRTYAEALRERALEAMHGNRSNSDKLGAAQSGRAMELLHQPLIQLADQLRANYGEDALVRLMQMVIAARQLMPLTFRNGDPVPEMPKGEQVVLKWGPWFAPTYRDRSEQATALKTNGDAGHISRESAVKAVAAVEDIEDPIEEVGRILSDIAADDARAMALKAQVQDRVSEPV